ncbi:MAG: hypothetical protein V4667_02420 [Bacteroidota bacterium]
MKSSPSKIIYIILCSIILVFFIIFIPFSLHEQKEIDKRLKIVGLVSTGTITSVHRSYGKSSGVYFGYKFQDEKGTVYKDSKKVRFHDLEIFLRKNFPVIYNPQNLRENEILMTKEEFENYGLNLPDSLKWTQGLRKY